MELKPPVADVEKTCWKKPGSTTEISGEMHGFCHETGCHGV